MNTKVYVGNLSSSTTQEELSTLFAQAGEVALTEIIKDYNGQSKGFGFVTMNSQSEGEKAIVDREKAIPLVHP